MTLEEFRATLKRPQPPQQLSPALQALWWDAAGNWTKAHESAQDDQSPAGSWVHAYLHRKEGDLSNAAYWYSRAARPPAREGLDEEWSAITTALLPK